MSILSVKNLSQGYDDKFLFDDAQMKMSKGEHIGLVGLNGAGKTTLFRAILGEVIPDKGEIEINKKSKFGYLDQNISIDLSMDIHEYLKSAFADLYDIDDKITKIYNQIENSDGDEQLKLLEAATNLQNILTTGEFELVEKKIKNVSRGLGIDQYGFETKIGELSGGQKAKVILSKLLLENNDVLLLDEPTNFLDDVFIEWLSSFLNNYKNAFMVISHDSVFLNKISKIILSVENKKIIRYIGNYDSYVSQREKKSEEYLKLYKSQQKFIKNTEDFISKNITRSSTANRAKSRIKMLDKIEKFEKPQSEKLPVFSFKYTKILPEQVVTAIDIEIGYNYPILPKLTFTVAKGEKCIIKGFNGIGKTTLLKTISNELKPLSGKLDVGESVVTSFFRQEEYCENLTPIDIIQRAYPNLNRTQVRSYLSMCGIKRDLMFQDMDRLSGGEQTKVRLCKFMLKPANFIILDEPTNHLDVNSKSSLINSLRNFDGSILLTTHDLNFDTGWANKIFDLEALYK